MDPISTKIALGAAGAGGAESYWIATLGGTSTDWAWGITTDSSGNTYVTGRTNSTGAGDYDLVIAKYDASGTIQWQRTLGGVNAEYGYTITTDSLGNVYLTGSTNSTGPADTNVLIAKYNSSGTIQWQRTLGGTGTDYGDGIAVDSSGNVYVAARTNSTGAGNYDLLIAKYSSSGTIQWQKVLGGVNIEHGWGIDTDSSGNVYVAGRTSSTGAGGYDLLIAKYNTSGTIQWQRTLGGTGTDHAYNLTTDSSGNVYVTGTTNSPGTTDVLIAKYNSSGTIQWQKSLQGTGSEWAYGIDTDSSGNVYVAGRTNTTPTGTTDVLIAKYDTSGTIQWQRTLDGSAVDIAYGLAVDNSGNVYVSGSTNSAGAGGTDLLIAKLPGDGSLTGTYGVWIYASSSFTSATTSFTAATSSLTDSSSSLTDAAASLTDSASSLTSSTTPM